MRRGPSLACKNRVRGQARNRAAAACGRLLARATWDQDRISRPRQNPANSVLTGASRSRPLLLHEHHYGRGGDDRFRQRGDVVDGVCVDTLCALLLLAKLAEGMNRKLVVPSHCEHASGEGAVRNGAIEQSRTQASVARSFRRRRDEASSGWRPRAGHRRGCAVPGTVTGIFPAIGTWPNMRSRDGALRYVVRGKFCDPGCRFGNRAIR